MEALAFDEKIFISQIKFTSMASTATTTSQILSWNMKADYVETCNCDYDCPCNFSGSPTYGNCRALLLFHIRSGSYGNTKLDGVDFILAQSWPKAP